jgi:D-alanyl-lipoteichoic acid acyltransferase DltB (MBOAT superfamily)
MSQNEIRLEQGISAAMNITSLNFGIFVGGALLIYYLLPRRPQNYWLLLVSYAFYLTWAWQFALILLVLTALNFFLAQRLRPEGQPRPRLLGAGIGLNVMALIFFRTADFFLPETIALLAGLGVATEAGGLQILVPLGLSYYILENISYLVDVYRGQLKAATDPVDFALYLAYFPKLVAGPIERARSFLPKLAQPRIVDNQLLARSFMLIVLGLLRKVLIADILAAAILPDVYETPAKYTPPELLGWLLLYAFSLYNDFAGYTNIVRGVSGLFGLELSANFQYPYFSRNFTEFWNRWHITLSHWLRDYIYFPVSRRLLRLNPSRRYLPNLILPPLTTMIVSGLWHGLSWQMLLWGALHGLYQVVERLPGLWRPIVPAQQQPLWRQALSMSLIFGLVILAWVPFGWGWPAAWEFWTGLLNWSSLAVRYRRLFLVAPLILLALGLDVAQAWSQDEYIFLRWPRLVQAAGLATTLLFMIILIESGSGEPFVYQGF